MAKGCWLAISLVATLVGCAGFVRTDVQTFHKLPSDMSQTVAVLPADETKEGSLEFRAFAALLEKGLADEGFRVVSIAEEPQLVAFLIYGVNQGRDELYSYSVPQWGQTGVRSSHTTGQVYSYGSRATYSGTTVHNPSYGITGYTTQVGTRRSYGRVALVHIYDISNPTQPERVYETMMTSEGSSGSIADVIDEMIEALFRDFRSQGHRVETITKK